MNLDYLEDLISRENINLIDTYLENTSGAFVNYDKINLILYDSKQMKNSSIKKQVLAEELGHYYMDATYKFNSDNTIIQKQEYRAKKWSYYVLIPFENLKLAILKRHR